jgi:hypothetical protein
LYADFVVICGHVIRDTPESFILTPAECKQLAHRGVNKKGEMSFWLQPKQYEAESFLEQWARFG